MRGVVLWAEDARLTAEVDMTGRYRGARDWWTSTDRPEMTWTGNNEQASLELPHLKRRGKCSTGGRSFFSGSPRRPPTAARTC